MRHKRLHSGRRIWLAGALAGGALAAAVALPTTAVATIDGCPELKPRLRLAMVTGTEIYSSHPAENRFSSTHYARLHQTPIFGVNPQETGFDAAYGAAESWEYKDGASGMTLKIRDGLTFNNGEPMTAEDVAFSVMLSQSKFADSQISGTLRKIGVKAKAVDDRTVEIDFAKGSPTFHLELSPLVFPLYVVSKKYHSNGDTSREAFDKFRADPLSAGPYKVVARQAEEFITLEAARKDPLLGCPVYERIEIRSVPETGTRISQFRTGQQDIVSGSRDLIPQAKRIGARIASKPDANTIGLYIFQADYPGNVFADENVRKAAAHAVDHKLIGETIFAATGIEPWGCTWPPPTEISTDNERYMEACKDPYPYDPDKAREYLKTAGYSDSKKPKINLEYSVSYPEEAAMAEAMQPMLQEVGFEVTVERVDIAERNRRRRNGGHINTILFFGPGGRVTALAGAFSVWGPDQNWGPKNDKDILAALTKASRASSIKDYKEGMADLAEAIHEKAYGPGFFSAGSIYFVRKGIPEWGLNKSKGRGPLNLSALATTR